jgi:hypothetical protein
MHNFISRLHRQVISLNCCIEIGSKHIGNESLSSLWAGARGEGGVNGVSYVLHVPNEFHAHGRHFFSFILIVVPYHLFVNVSLHLMLMKAPLKLLTSD